MVIYKIVDEKTENCYVGKAIDFVSRKKQHIKLLEKRKHHNFHIQNIFNLDSNRIKFEIIHEGISSVEELNYLEKEEIKKQGTFNLTCGGDGGDTLSFHPRKEEIFTKRKEKYVSPKGEKNACYIKLEIEEEKNLLEIWSSLNPPSLKELSKLTGFSTYICKRTLTDNSINIPTKHQTQKELRSKGVIRPSRRPKFEQRDVEYILKRYLEDWIGCKQIAAELGFKSESPILKVIKQHNLLRSKSEWTKKSNRNRINFKYKKSCRLD